MVNMIIDGKQISAEENITIMEAEIGRASCRERV